MIKKAILLLFFLPAMVWADPPVNKKLERENNVFDFTAFLALKAFSKSLNSTIKWDENKLADSLVKHTTKLAVGVLIFEFATGNGPIKRQFTESDSFTQALKMSPAMKEIYKQVINDTFDNHKTYRFQFSPTKSIKTWGPSLKRHYEVAKAKNLNQFFLGSFFVDVKRIGNTLDFTISNETSRKSLYLTIFKKKRRPDLLGSIFQEFNFQLSRQELQKLIK